MAKSAGEFLRVQALVDRGYDPLAYRYLCLTAHYRSQLNFSWDALDAAAIGLDRMRRAVHAMPTGGDPDRSYLERFTGLVNDDLNLPKALALAWELLRGELGDRSTTRATLLAFDRVFGFGLEAWRPPAENVPEAVHALAAARAAARSAKQWAEADRLRAELHAAGWEMEDRGDAYVLRRK
jgi:cysteinyl-tRNA synthetase